MGINNISVPYKLSANIRVFFSLLFFLVLKTCFSILFMTYYPLLQFMNKHIIIGRQNISVPYQLSNDIIELFLFNPLFVVI